MRNLLYILIFMRAFNLFSQATYDENIEALIDQYTVKPELQCEILVQVAVEGMSIPDKKIFVDFKNRDKPKVQGEGLALLPKKGTVDQFSELLSSPLQAIYLSKRKSNLVYKLVSLDQNSDWITADIIFDEKTFVIYESLVNTRKLGSIRTEHRYEAGIYPSSSVITFDIKKFRIPLKFIGREQRIADYPKKDENVQGKITLTYTYLD